MRALPYMKMAGRPRARPIVETVNSVLVDAARAHNRPAQAFAVVAGLDALGELPAAQAEILHTALRTQLAAGFCGLRTKAERHQHGGSQPAAQTPEYLPARERSGQRLG